MTQNSIQGDLKTELSTLMHKRLENADSEFKEIYPKILENVNREVFGDMSDEDLYNVFKKQYFGDDRIKFKTSYCKRIFEIRKMLEAMKKKTHQM